MDVDSSQRQMAAYLGLHTFETYAAARERIIADQGQAMLELSTPVVRLWEGIIAVEIVDSFIGRMLATIGSISRLFDAETVLVGMRPAVAITLTELGLSLRGVRTALNAEKGLALLNGSS